MTDHPIQDRLIRVEAKQEALDTYLPALLTRVEAGFAELRGDMRAMQSELRDDMGALRSELRNDMGALRSEMRDDMRAMETNLRSDMRAGRWERLALTGTLAVGFASVTVTLLAILLTG